ncbi:hypothetical protein EVAR_17998_1 [Eumeta japonica]|uniref:Uncharacterized protein n=1 Tax=Eumeta variegata TaxID=151549 RepID=A0A4C1Y9R9_EUMVA|nr:hypothetical protein EVAR_17998_1 [Eumeta japonica]
MSDPLPSAAAPNLGTPFFFAAINCTFQCFTFGQLNITQTHSPMGTCIYVFNRDPPEGGWSAPSIDSFNPREITKVLLVSGSGKVTCVVLYDVYASTCFVASDSISTQFGRHRYGDAENDIEGHLARPRVGIGGRDD